MRDLVKRALRAAHTPYATKRKHKSDATFERAENVAIQCGWGRLLLAPTWQDAGTLAQALLQEAEGQRDIAIYVAEPQRVIAHAPQQLFLDPSEFWRLNLQTYRAPRREAPRPFGLRRLRTRADIAAINTLYRARGMVPVYPQIVWELRLSRAVTYALAEDRETGEVIGVAMGLDHVEAFADTENGSSLWALAVDPQTPHPGVGEALVRYLAERFQALGRSWMDVSVLHDNDQAIALYEKLGFVRIPAFAVKRRNAINQPLFLGEVAGLNQLNPYARILVDEALRRGIHVEILDAESGFFRLTLGARSILCRESLSELTSAVAMSLCQDKRLTVRWLAKAGLRVPEQVDANDTAAWQRLLTQYGSVVVKPVDGEQGHGISVDLRSESEVAAAIERARQFSERVLVEQFCRGEDLRVVVIDGEVIAAALRRPPVIVGDGRHTVRALIERYNRRRAAATGGESRVPLDDETRRCLQAQGFDWDDVPGVDVRLLARKTANLHTGGTLHDVTAQLHPTLRDAAERAARALQIPVTGLDFLVDAPDQPNYVIIEANERPGLANHEPQPTAQRFIDLLFPQTRQRP